MAYITHRPGAQRYDVHQGVTGERLTSWNTLAEAEAEVRRLHRKNDPEARNRGARAEARAETRERRE